MTKRSVGVAPPQNRRRFLQTSGLLVTGATLGRSDVSIPLDLPTQLGRASLPLWDSPSARHLISVLLLALAVPAGAREITLLVEKISPAD